MKQELTLLLLLLLLQWIEKMGENKIHRKKQFSWIVEYIYSIQRRTSHLINFFFLFLFLYPQFHLFFHVSILLPVVSIFIILLSLLNNLIPHLFIFSIFTRIL